MKILIAALLLATMSAQAQVVVTKCTNGQDVIFVQGYVCPMGWWRTF